MSTPNIFAVRHPKSGKSHRATTDAYTSTLHPGWTVCGRPAANMTERIEVRFTAPEDRCKRCWPAQETTA